MAPSATRSFPRIARCRRRRRRSIWRTCSGNLLGHFDASQIPPVPERQNVAQGPRGRVPQVAHRREIRRRAPPAALHRVPAGRGHRRCTITRSKRAYFILSGEVEATMDGKIYTGRPGDVLWTGVGCVHAFANVSRAAGALARDVCAAAAEGERVPLHGGMGTREPKSWRDRTMTSTTRQAARGHSPAPSTSRASATAARSGFTANASRTSRRIPRSATPRG